MTRRDIPNLISILRIVLVAPIVWLLVQREFGLALALFLVAGISDGLDGYLAKRNQWVSRLGSILDPLADKFLLVSSFITLTWLQAIPLWLLIIVIARDLLIVVGGVAYHYLIGKFDTQPSIISKVNTFLQIVLVLTIIFSLGIYPISDWLITLLVYTVLATTLVSGAQYVVVWSKRVRDSKS